MGCAQAQLLQPCPHPVLAPSTPGLLTCTTQAYLHAGSLEFTVALVLGHNEVAAAVQAGYEGGEVAVLAAAIKRGKARAREARHPALGTRSARPSLKCR